jgi:hypothetical protein
MKGYADRLKELPSGTNDIGIEVELGKPICQPLDADEFKRRLNIHLADYNFSIGEFRIRSMPTSLSLNINEYSADCHCGGKHRTGYRICVVVIVLFLFVFGCIRKAGQ